MIKRTIEISSEAAHLTVKHRQMLIQRDRKTVGSVPCEDIGIVLVDHPGTTYTHAALSSLAASDAALVVCNEQHLPAAILLPLTDHSQVVWRLNDQINASKPLCKRLWKQIVQAKIRAQAYVLAADSKPQRKLLDMAKQVRSGDPQNMEAQAARVYWQYFLDEEPFRRDRDASDVNAFLNYGYAVMRAAVARALVAAGLFPAIGLHHRNRSNSFCLADDLMEPLRPMVDARARELRELGHDELTVEAKRGLLELLGERVTSGDEVGPLMVHVHRMASSLAKCFAGEAKQLQIPVRSDANEIAENQDAD